MSARFYVVHDDRNAAEIDAVDEPQGFTVQSSESEWRDVIGVQCNPDGTVTVGHWPDGETWVALGTVDAHSERAETAVCRHCQRDIEKRDGRWIDPQANGDDSVWRETCDEHDTFAAEHEPAHWVGDECLGQHEWVTPTPYLICGQDFMAGTICSLPAGHLERDGTDHA
jgi:hypothetical protein